MMVVRIRMVGAVGAILIVVGGPLPATAGSPAPNATVRQGAPAGRSG